MSVMKTSDGSPLWTARMTSGSLDEVRLYDDRITVLAGTHMYVLALDGRKMAHSRLPPDTCAVCVGGESVAVATRGGRIIVLSSRDGRTVWEQSVGGQAWDLDIAADSLYVTAGIPTEKMGKRPDGTPESPAPRSAQEQLLEEMKGQYGGYSDADDLRSRPECRTLINYRLADGKERWRREAAIGELHVLPDGNCLLLAQGHEAAGLFLNGTGSFVSEHLQRNGRRAWGYKVQEATRLLRADANSVYLITGPGSSILFGKWTDSPVQEGTVRVVRRRTLINRVRKF
jgi:outer membrane protein assembly factor BamB